jgi:F-box-like/Ankyrin repeats (3 copies)/Ankyrin repeat
MTSCPHAQSDATMVHVDDSGIIGSVAVSSDSADSQPDDYQYSPCVAAAETNATTASGSLLLTVLPDDILLHVLSLLGIADHLKCARVCKAMQTAALDMHSWRTLDLQHIYLGSTADDVKVMLARFEHLKHVECIRIDISYCRYARRLSSQFNVDFFRFANGMDNLRQVMLSGVRIGMVQEYRQLSGSSNTTFNNHHHDHNSEEHFGFQHIHSKPLEHVEFHGCVLPAAMFHSLATLPLRSLTIDRCVITEGTADEVMSSMATCLSLRHIHLAWMDISSLQWASEMQLTSFTLRRTSSMPAHHVYWILQHPLQYLYLDDDIITDAFFLQASAEQCNVQHLVINSRKISDAGMEYISRLPSLARLSLHCPNITFEGLSRLHELVVERKQTTVTLGAFVIRSLLDSTVARAGDDQPFNCTAMSVLCHSRYDRSLDGEILAAAIRSGNTEFLRMALDSGISPNQSFRARVPILQAISNRVNAAEMVHMLIEKGASPHSVHAPNGLITTTPLIMAIESGGDEKEKVVCSLLENKVATDLRVHRGWNALHYASRLGYSRICALILRANADLINSQTTDGKQNTPLHLAAFEGHANVVQCLLVCGKPDCDATNAQQLTALQLARRCGFQKIVGLLQKH